ncbi:calsequestrin [Caerostris extrusa]|uniref:Calsequestrin n=1 Tax=Caerostris extrusa TaxID=172846 RepID=A0AAV4VBM3_CAEEX|nr:calsequestrin [Caerostris extrusa]
MYLKGAQVFVQTPTSQTVAENSDIVLECYENPVGEIAFWLKDGKNIGYNLDRYQHYNWRGDRLAGDCSLVIIGAKAGRDNVKVLITAAEPSSSGTVKTEL